MRDARRSSARTIGLSLIGSEHQHQHQLIAALLDALTVGGPAAAAELSDLLLHLIQVHAMTEELLMRLYRFPDAEAHVRQHSEMVKRPAGSSTISVPAMPSALSPR